MLDILAQIPSNVEKINLLDSSNETAEEKSRKSSELLEHGETLENLLESWHTSLTERNLDPLYWNGSPDCGSENFFSMPLEFPSLREAQLLLFYWTAKILQHNVNVRLHQILHRRISSTSRPSPSQQKGQFTGFPTTIDPRILLDTDGHAEPNASSNKKEQIEMAADKICRSAAYCQRPCNGIMGLQFTILPLRTAANFYRDNGMEVKSMWCHRNFKKLAERDFPIIVQLMRS